VTKAENAILLPILLFFLLSFLLVLLFLLPLLWMTMHGLRFQLHPHPSIKNIGYTKNQLKTSSEFLMRYTHNHKETLEKYYYVRAHLNISTRF